MNTNADKHRIFIFCLYLFCKMELKPNFIFRINVRWFNITPIILNSNRKLEVSQQNNGPRIICIESIQKTRKTNKLINSVHLSYFLLLNYQVIIFNSIYQIRRTIDLVHPLFIRQSSEQEHFIYTFVFKFTGF